MGVRIYCSLHNFLLVLKGKERFKSYKGREVLIFGSQEGYAYEQIGKGRINEAGKVDPDRDTLKNAGKYVKFILQIEDKKKEKGGKR